MLVYIGTSIILYNSESKIAYKVESSYVVKGKVMILINIENVTKTLNLRIHNEKFIMITFFLNFHWFHIRDSYLSDNTFRTLCELPLVRCIKDVILLGKIV